MVHFGRNVNCYLKFYENKTISIILTIILLNFVINRTHDSATCGKCVYGHGMA